MFFFYFLSLPASSSFNQVDYYHQFGPSLPRQRPAVRILLLQIRKASIFFLPDAVARRSNSAKFSTEQTGSHNNIRLIFIVRTKI